VGSEAAGARECAQPLPSEEEHLKRLHGLPPGRQDQNLFLTDLNVPRLLDSGAGQRTPVFSPSGRERSGEQKHATKEAGSYLGLLDFVYHSTLGLRVMQKRKKERKTRPKHSPQAETPHTPLYREVEPEQWLQRHPEAGSSWPSWPKASHPHGGP